MNRRRFCLGTGAGLLTLHVGCNSGGLDTNADLGDIDQAGADQAGADQTSAASCGGVAAGTVASLASGTAQFLSSQSAFVCRDAKGVFAVTSTCTHQGCDVDFVSASSGFQCPCHGARFSFDGALLQGPARQPLRNYRVCVDVAGNVTIDPSVIVPAGTRTPV